MKCRLDEKGNLCSVIDEIEYKNEIEQERNSLIIQNKISDDEINFLLKKEKLEEGELEKIELRKRVDEIYLAKLKELDNYFPLETISYEEELAEDETLIPYYIQGKDRIYKKYKVRRDISIIQDKIKSLKQQLIDTDYKVIKMYEAKLLMEELPYDEEELRIRQSIRDRINELEKLL